jgi:hypothetical protein
MRPFKLIFLLIVACVGPSFYISAFSADENKYSDKDVRTFDIGTGMPIFMELMLPDGRKVGRLDGQKLQETTGVYVDELDGYTATIGMKNPQKNLEYILTVTSDKPESFIYNVSVSYHFYPSKKTTLEKYNTKGIKLMPGQDSVPEKVLKWSTAEGEISKGKIDTYIIRINDMADVLQKSEYAKKSETGGTHFGDGIEIHKK